MKKFIMMAIFLLMPVSANAKTIEMGRFKLTAYCPCYECSEGWCRRTCTGGHCRSEHTIAVDPDIIDFGSEVLIGGKVYVAEDCGGAVEGDHVDIFVDTHEEVEEFGTRYKDIWVLK